MPDREIITRLKGLATLVVMIVSTTVIADSRLPGGIAVIPVSIAIDDGTTPLIRFGRRPVLVLRESTRWLAVVGIARTTVPGEYIISVSDSHSKPTAHNFRVNPDESATVSAHPDPDYTDELSFDDSRQARLPLQQPTVGEVRRPFALDFPATEIESTNATSVVSPSDGVIHSVSASGPTGDRVIINHGQGLYSVLSPVYDLRARKDEAIVQSQILGTTGAMTAGAVSGVRWQVVLNGTLVNPELLKFWPTPD